MAWRPIGRTEVRTTRLGLGTTAIGGLFEAVDDATAAAVCERAWELGVRTFDTAPHYGYGLAERRLGAMLRDRPREAYTLSSKVGRLIRPIAEADPSQERLFAGAEDVGPAWDFSRSGVLRSIDESLGRLGVERLDIVYLHSPDAHWQPAVEEAYPALHELRGEGHIGAIGVGMTQAPMLTRFVRETDIDVVLCAGRYTLLDQSALDELLPACQEAGVSVVIGGVLNSGILADPSDGSRFDYRPAPPDVLDRARRIEAVCRRHGVSLRDAAIQLPLAHPAVAAVLAGARSPAELEDYPAAMARAIPTALWDELREASLLDDRVPLPSR